MFIMRLLKVWLIPTLFFLSSSIVFAQHQTTYTSSNSIAKEINKYVDVPDIVSKLDLKITITAYPRRGYYKSEIKLLTQKGRIGGFYKTLEIWEPNTKINPSNSAIVKSYIDVDLNIRLRLIKKIAECIVEKEVLKAERLYLQ